MQFQPASTLFSCLPSPQAPPLWTPQLVSMMLIAYARNNCVHLPASRRLLSALADEALRQLQATDCQVNHLTMDMPWWSAWPASYSHNIVRTDRKTWDASQPCCNLIPFSARFLTEYESMSIVLHNWARALRQLQKKFCVRDPAVRRQSLANVAWATACAGCMRVELLRPLQARALELAHKFSDRELKQFYQAELTLRLETPDSCAHRLWPQPVVSCSV